MNREKQSFSLVDCLLVFALMFGVYELSSSRAIIHPTPPGPCGAAPEICRMYNALPPSCASDRRLDGGAGNLFESIEATLDGGTMTCKGAPTDC